MNHTSIDEMKAHEDMSLIKLAEHLGVKLWQAMEIARWTSIRPNPIDKCPDCPSCGSKLKREVFDKIIRITCGMRPYEMTENKEVAKKPFPAKDIEALNKDQALTEIKKLEEETILLRKKHYQK